MILQASQVASMQCVGSNAAEDMRVLLLLILLFSYRRHRTGPALLYIEGRHIIEVGDNIYTILSYRNIISLAVITSYVLYNNFVASNSTVRYIAINYLANSQLKTQQGNYATLLAGRGIIIIIIKLER